MPRNRSLKSRLRLSATGLGAALLLVVGLLAAGFGPAASGAPVPPTLIVTASTDYTGLTGVENPFEGAPTGALPGVLAAQGTPIKITLRLSDGSDLSRGTVFDLTGTPPGTFSPTSFRVPAKAPTATFSVSYSQAQENVVLRAVARTTTNESPLSGESKPFDVLEALTITPKGSPLLGTGLGADTCNAKTNVSVCGVVVLPRGIGSAAAALSSGPCPLTVDGCTGNKEVQFLAGLKDVDGNDIYSRTSPASLLLQCDKTKCPGKGVTSYQAKMSPLAADAEPPLDPSLVVAPACPSKGVMPADENVDFCTDYVSSKRNNAGDLILVVLFFKDMRGTI